MTPARASGRSACQTLTARELRRLARQPSRIIAAVGTPALLWIFLASGFAESFAPPARNGVAASAVAPTSYAAYLLPGVVTLIALFSSIFAAMSLIEDRHEGFLRTALVSPAPTWSIIGAKAVGGAIFATLQSVLALAAAPLVGLQPGLMGFASAAVAIGLISFAVTGLGLAAAWWVNSSAGFHGVMNLVLMPMWLLSGAFFPAEGASGWLAVMMLANPLRWGTEALRASLAGAPGEATLAWVILTGFAGAMGAIALLTAGRRSTRHL